MKTEVKMTWQELKDFCNQLNAEHLQSPVMWWGDERGGFIGQAVLLKEDYALDDEGWQPKSVIPEDDFEYIHSELPKGNPVLLADEYDEN